MVLSELDVIYKSYTGNIVKGSKLLLLLLRGRRRTRRARRRRRRTRINVLIKPNAPEG